jgi:hypothetical protein
MKIKDGASVQGCHWRMFDAALKIERVLGEYGFELTITAGTDGQHGPHSLHYQGLAIDFRTREISPGQQVKVYRDIKLALGNDFDVVQEADHGHAEYDPQHNGTPVLN